MPTNTRSKSFMAAIEMNKGIYNVADHFQDLGNHSHFLENRLLRNTMPVEG
jgi:hypothetical protein